MKLILFDLDGTLVDSTEDIALSVNELLESLGRAPLQHERIRGFIGDGVEKLLERALESACAEEVSSARAPYLSIYRRRLLDHTCPYPGVVPALDALGVGRDLAVLTNKPLRETRLILEGLSLERYFRSVYGGDSFARKKPDPAGVFHVLEEVGASAEETLFVGDSGVDVECARRAGVASCLVSYAHEGVMDPSLRADHYVRDLREIIALVHP